MEIPGKEATGVRQATASGPLMLPSTSSSQAVAATRGGGNTEETGGSNKMEGNKADQTDGANKATENEGSLVETDKPIGLLAK